MIRHDVPVCECDQCGHRWIQEGQKLPERCPSRKCRSAKWNPSFVEQAIERGRKVGAVAVRINDVEFPVIGDERLPPGVIATVENLRFERTSHDPKTCRIYHCLMCKVAKT